MSLFEYDGERLVPAEVGQPGPDEIAPELLQAVRDQVLDVVRRRLFPVRWHDASRRPGTLASAEPSPRRLTAMDAAAQVVTVEVVDRLDAAALVAALSRSARSAELGWAELGVLYPSGPAALRRDWAAFRETAPARPEPGPRLILVAARVADEVRQALGALGGSGVVVHEITVRQTGSGRQLLEVTELRPDLLAPSAPVLAPARRPGLALPVGRTVDDGARPGDDGAEPGANGLHRGADGDGDRFPVGTDRVDDRAHTGTDRGTGDSAVPVAAGAARTSAPAASAGAEPAPAAGGGQRVVGGGQRVGGGEEPASAADGLAAVAATLDEDVPLVWAQLRRGIRHEATLTTAGTIVVADGTVHTDPDAAARAASGRQVDGWRVWRLGGETGPNLGEVRAEQTTDGRSSGPS
ncbi:hypothetical protein MF406_16650 [Georgenia sp. TF02-10]|uniref:restriction system modified-DNA reader domain-containing protein n=1 Tax=Georgenia sp. TF02-10 TaxID=2917725 RepID=UPI001FA7B3CD|nr:hypothetical protein [Georgenia sp. TF02-10]UNX54495.1 hypothetical protein MF406_16650 [Georgenia sp. TF02-10]